MLLQLRELLSKQLHTAGTDEKAASSGSEGGKYFRWISHKLDCTTVSKTFSWSEFGLKVGAIDSCLEA